MKERNMVEIPNKTKVSDLIAYICFVVAALAGVSLLAIIGMLFGDTKFTAIEQMEALTRFGLLLGTTGILGALSHLIALAEEHMTNYLKWSASS